MVNAPDKKLGSASFRLVFITSIFLCYFQSLPETFFHQYLHLYSASAKVKAPDMQKAAVFLIIPVSINAKKYTEPQCVNWYK